MENEPHGDISVELRYKEPSAKVMARYMISYTFPYFSWSTLRGWLISEVDLGCILLNI
jgi:hypothetical protein